MLRCVRASNAASTTSVAELPASRGGGVAPVPAAPSAPSAEGLLLLLPLLQGTTSMMLRTRPSSSDEKDW